MLKSQKKKKKRSKKSRTRPVRKRVKTQEKTQYPYWVLTEKNGWELETWKFYFTDVTPEMEKLMKNLITKAHRFTEGHEKTSFAHKPKPDYEIGGIPMSAFGYKSVVVCTSCTKFSFINCKLTKSRVKKLVEKNEGYYMSAHCLGGILDLETLKKWTQLSDQDVFDKLYKGGIAQ